MTKELDWVDYFDKAYENALICGSGFIKVSVNGPEGLSLSVVDPKDYFYLGEKVPEKYAYGTPLLDAMTQDYTPPKREWVGLTNVEIGTIAYNINPLDGITDFVRAIEAALRSKNT